MANVAATMVIEIARFNQNHDKTMKEQLTPSDIRTMARKAADYITFNCDEISEGFEITHKGQRYSSTIRPGCATTNWPNLRRFPQYGTKRAGSARRSPKPCN